MQSKYNALAIFWQLLQNPGLNMMTQMDVFHLWNSTWGHTYFRCYRFGWPYFCEAGRYFNSSSFGGMKESTLHSSSNLGLKQKQSYRTKLFPFPKGKGKQNTQSSLDKNIQAIKKFSDSWKLDFKEMWQAGEHLTQSTPVVPQLAWPWAVSGTFVKTNYSTNREYKSEQELKTEWHTTTGCIDLDVSRADGTRQNCQSKRCLVQSLYLTFHAQHVA